MKDKTFMVTLVETIERVYWLDAETDEQARHVFEEMPEADRARQLGIIRSVDRHVSAVERDTTADRPFQLRPGFVLLKEYQ